VLQVLRQPLGSDIRAWLKTGGHCTLGIFRLFIDFVASHSFVG
jgi:hypothetical protein